MKKALKWGGIFIGLLLIIIVSAAIFSGSEEASTTEDMDTLNHIGKNGEFFEEKDFKAVDNKKQAFEKGDILKLGNIVIMVQDSFLAPKDMMLEEYPEAASVEENVPILDVKFELLNLGEENVSLVPEAFELVNNGEAYSGALINSKTSIKDIKKGETRLMKAAFKAPLYEDPTRPYEVIVYLEKSDKKLLPVKFNVNPKR